MAPCGRHITCIYLMPGLAYCSSPSPCGVKRFSLACLLDCRLSFSFLFLCVVFGSAGTTFPLGCTIFCFLLWGAGGAATFVGR